MFQDDSRTSKSFGIFIDVAAIAIAYWGAFQGFLTYLTQESEFVYLYYLINIIPMLWFTWFICTKNRVYKETICWFAFIPLGFTILFWLVGSVPLFEDEELIFQLIVYLIIFLANGVWELLKPTKADTKLSVVLSIVLFGLTLDIYNGTSNKLVGVMGLLDELNPFQFHKYAFYGLLIFFVGHLLLNLVQNVAVIKEQALKQPKVEEKVVYVDRPVAAEDNLIEDIIE